MLATLYANSHSKDGKYKIYDFMPNDVEPPLTLDQAMESWA